MTLRMLRRKNSSFMLELKSICLVFSLFFCFFLILSSHSLRKKLSPEQQLISFIENRSEEWNFIFTSFLRHPTWDKKNGEWERESERKKNILNGWWIWRRRSKNYNKIRLGKIFKANIRKLRFKCDRTMEREKEREGKRKKTKIFFTSNILFSRCEDASEGLKTKLSYFTNLFLFSPVSIIQRH